MPKGVRAATFKLPEEFKIETINGQDFVRIQAAAKISGIHPVVLSMGQRLLKNPSDGGVFKLGDPDMMKNASAIEAEFVKGLRKVSKALGSGQKAKSFLDYEQKRIVFWYAA